MAKDRSENGDAKPSKAKKGGQRQAGRGASARRSATPQEETRAEETGRETQGVANEIGGDRGKIISATMRLAERQGWADVSLRDIARESGVSLATLRSRYPSKGAILADFVTSIDEAVLDRAERETSRDESETPRDRLFDVIMMRLELLEPYKPALKAIVRDAARTLDGLPELFSVQLHSKRWMLTAADIDARGVDGAVKALGLSAMYGRVLRVWLDEDDPAMPKTLAELDRQLRRGVRTLSRIQGPVSLACSSFRIACSFGRQLRDLGKDYRRERRDRDMQAGDEAEAAS
ncbi:TetR/AcrR family transcriptional regulator [Rhodoligotrophos ferricapiens]|uniref:TetR/AcrR family transcriptional regulator n=1 Tax=Rhodoligotrophos ferricapiens TaxID=3069264 RepID=UPI00315D6147